VHAAHRVDEPAAAAHPIKPASSRPISTGSRVRSKGSRSNQLSTLTIRFPTVVSVRQISAVTPPSAKVGGATIAPRSNRSSSSSSSAGGARRAWPARYLTRLERDGYLFHREGLPELLEETRRAFRR